MNCAQAVRMLDAWLDAELDPVTAAQLADHVAGCAACAAAREQRVALSAAMREPALRYPAPPSLRTAIRERTVPGGRASRSAPGIALRSRWPWLPGWPALVFAGSTAVLGAVCGWWIAQPAQLDAFAPEPVADYAVTRHVAALTPGSAHIDVASSDRHAVRPWFQGRLDFAPAVRDLSEFGFVLVGARIDRMNNQPAAAIVYRLRGHMIDVFSWRATGRSVQPDQASTIRGFNVQTWQQQDIDYAVVSDMDLAEMQRFTAALRAP